MRETSGDTDSNASPNEPLTRADAKPPAEEPPNATALLLATLASGRSDTFDLDAISDAWSGKADMSIGSSWIEAAIEAATGSAAERVARRVIGLVRDGAAAAFSRWTSEADALNGRTAATGARGTFVAAGVDDEAAREGNFRPKACAL